MMVERARGVRVNGLLDFTSGWLVANIGHDNPAVMRAVRKAHGWAVLDRWTNPAREEAKRALLGTLPRVFTDLEFFSTGSEAIDVALRMAGGPVIAHPRAFHGSTIGAQSIKRVPFGGPLPSASVMVETFLGPWCEWHPPEIINRLRTHQLARRGLLIFDEMQSGAGRTGRWWGFEHYDITPDIVVGGKAIAGGFPLAFVAWRGDLDFQPMFASTFSGNAPCCAACAATIREIEQRRLIENVRDLEPMIQEAFPEAIGKGFAYAFKHPDADAVVDRALSRGLMLLHIGRGTVKIAPPLCISRRDLKRGLDILKRCV